MTFMSTIEKWNKLWRDYLYLRESSGQKLVCMGTYNYADIQIEKYKEPILDLGCGDFECIDKLIGSDKIYIIGLDISDLALSYAKKHVNDNRDFVNSVASYLPFKEKVFGTIICSSLMHYPEVECENTLMECHRILKDEGDLILSVRHKEYYLGINNLKRVQLREDKNVYSRSDGKPLTKEASSLRLFDEDGISEVVEKLGFAIVSQEVKTAQENFDCSPYEPYHRDIRSSKAKTDIYLHLVKKL